MEFNVANLPRSNEHVPSLANDTMSIRTAPVMMD